LEYAVANRLPPSKESGAKAWISQEAFETYLGTAGSPVSPDQVAKHVYDDSDTFDREHTIGIGIDPKTGCQDGERFYSAHYLRLRERWQLGVYAMADDKEFKSPEHGNDLVKALLNGGHHQIIVGGQQRICSAKTVEGAPLVMPRGKTDGFNERNEKVLVKWILLSPAIWPAINAEVERDINAHPGGWLPNWINPYNGDVLLKSGDVGRRESESRDVWRQRVRRQGNISAKLVSAIVSKPIVVTGWSLPDEGGAGDAEKSGGAQSTHLAVPAGSVYYFEANSRVEAAKLAAALNWHGSDSQRTTIKNRRSTLLGEKGFGLGVCGTRRFHGKV